MLLPAPREYKGPTASTDMLAILFQALTKIFQQIDHASQKYTHELSLPRTENVDSKFYPITSRKPSNTTLRIFPVKYPPKQTFGATFSLLKKCQNQVGQGIPPHFLRRPKHKLTGNFALVYNTSIFSCRKVHSFRIHATFILYVRPSKEYCIYG